MSTDTNWLAPESRHDGLPFRSSHWVRACAEAKGGQLLEVAPNLLLVQRRIGPWIVAGMPLPKTGTPVTAGLNGTRAENDASLRVMDNWFRGSGLSMLQVTSSTPPPEDISPSRIERLQNLEIGLDKPCETLWKNMSSLPRRQIKKAVAAGIKVHLVSPETAHLQRHEEIAAEIFSATRERPILLPSQRVAMSSSPLKPFLRVFAASRNGAYLGYLLGVQHGDRSYYWDVAVDSSGRESGAGHLLVWMWMRWCKRRDIAVLDMMGPPEGGRAGGRAGIGRFKMAFGAKPQDYSVIYWMRHGSGIALNISRIWARAKTKLRT